MLVMREGGAGGGAILPRAFGLWRVCFPPCLVRPGRRLPVQGLSPCAPASSYHALPRLRKRQLFSNPRFFFRHEQLRGRRAGAATAPWACASSYMAVRARSHTHAHQTALPAVALPPCRPHRAARAHVPVPCLARHRTRRRRSRMRASSSAGCWRSAATYA